MLLSAKSYASKKVLTFLTKTAISQIAHIIPTLNAVDDVLGSFPNGNKLCGIQQIISTAKPIDAVLCINQIVAIR